MKKALILCLCFLLCISFFGCVKDSENAGGSEINSESENENGTPDQDAEFVAAVDMPLHTMMD